MREYTPAMLEVVHSSLAQWADGEGCVQLYSAARCFAFDVATTVLLGTRFDGDCISERAHLLYMHGGLQVPCDMSMCRAFAPDHTWPILANLSCIGVGACIREDA